MSPLPQESEARLRAMEKQAMSQVQRMTELEKAVTGLVASVHCVTTELDGCSSSCASLQATENHCKIDPAQEEYKMDLANPSNLVKPQVDLSFLHDLWLTFYLFPCMITIIWLTLLHTESDDLYMDHILVRILPTIGVMAAVASFCGSVLVFALKSILKQEIVRIALGRTATHTTATAKVCARSLVNMYGTGRTKLAHFCQQLRPSAGAMRRFLKCIAVIGICALLYASEFYFQFATWVVGDTVSFIISFYIKQPLFLLPAVASGLILQFLFQAKEGVDDGQQAAVDQDDKTRFSTIRKDTLIVPFTSHSSREEESEEEYCSDEEYQNEEGAGYSSHSTAEQESAWKTRRAMWLIGRCWRRTTRSRCRQAIEMLITPQCLLVARSASDGKVALKHCVRRFMAMLNQSE
ncbi:hypothetical protein Tdes44962_MAKER04082 [Teratosphaeria destructans]|uniref:Uncharacterized protein n=1 Tax=Teratosphaeria destructans TaxID=418781 RepID=A0A9W7W0V3_9PEZI|nr:hypothetical protein Tdes44962_MAKER04082 [Teratosphaeria destructans]